MQCFIRTAVKKWKEKMPERLKVWSMHTFLCAFPRGRAKALTFSFDDGVVQDEWLVKAFCERKNEGTFNINAGLCTYDEVDYDKLNWMYFPIKNIQKRNGQRSGHKIIWCKRHGSSLSWLYACTARFAGYGFHYARADFWQSGARKNLQKEYPRFCISSGYYQRYSDILSAAMRLAVWQIGWGLLPLLLFRRSV